MKIAKIGLLAATLGALPLVACDGDDSAAKADDGSLLSPYLAIGDALAKDDGEAVGALATKLKSAAESKKTEAGAEEILKGAASLSATDLAATRSAFKTVSAGMIEYLKAHPDEREGHTIVHCPMTFDGKGGLWVQAEGKVMNPYEGSRMLHCGEKLGWKAELPQT